MADRRIRIPEQFSRLVDELSDRSDEKSPFRSKADVLAFAASLGLRRDAKEPFEEATRDPIRYEVFERQGYDTLFNLMAIADNGDSSVLANDDAAEDIRATVFEEYANGGMQLLDDELRGIVDMTERVEKLVQIMGDERPKEADDEAYDISKLIIGD